MICMMEKPVDLTHHHSFSRKQFETGSLPRRQRLLSLPHSVDLSLECNCSHNRPPTPEARTAPRFRPGVMRSQSASAVRPDFRLRNSTLNEVVEKFEEVLREQRKKQGKSRFSPFHVPESRPINHHNPHAHRNLLSDYRRHEASPPSVPPFGFLPDHPHHQRIMTRHNEQQTEDPDSRLAPDRNLRAFVLLRQNTVPSNGFQKEGDKSPDVSDSKQFRESSYIIRRNASWAGSGRRTGDIQSSSCSSSTSTDQGTGGGAFGDDSPAESIGTRSVSGDSAVTGSKELTLESLEGVTLCPSPTPSVRSIGISANFAPSLSRTTNYHSLIKSFADSCQVGTQTDRAFRREVAIQVLPIVYSVATRTELPMTISTGVTASPDLGPSIATQTFKACMVDEETQIEGQCLSCGQKRMKESVGVGDDTIIDTCDVGVGPDDNMFERGKPPISQKAPSLQPVGPTVSTGLITISKIPRLSESPVRDSCEDHNHEESSGQLVIEEGADEILVYRRPDSACGKHRANLPQMISDETPHLETVCKIIDDSESECSSDSGSEGEALASCRFQKRTRSEPSKEMIAALNILNESLNTANANQKSASSSKSVKVAEGEWFKISSSKNSDPSTIKDYLDVFEKFSNHLSNVIVNMSDCNGNTAMHYAISYSNFEAASVLLDSKVCDVNKFNRVRIN